MYNQLTSKNHNHLYISYMNRQNRKKTYFLFLLLIIFIFSICITGFSRVEANPSIHQKYFTNITIEEGDTLWTIAETNITEEYTSVKEYIEEIKEINHLKGDEITEGRHIVIPHYTSD